MKVISERVSWLVFSISDSTFMRKESAMVQPRAPILNLYIRTILTQMSRDFDWNFARLRFSVFVSCG